MVKNQPANAGETGLIPDLGDPICCGVTQPVRVCVCVCVCACMRVCMFAF